MAAGPRFGQQALALAATLIDLAAILPHRIVVHALPGSDSAVRRQLESAGVLVLDTEPFDTEFPHCNKLRQLEHSGFDDAAAVAFCDTDLAFTGPIDDLLPVSAIRAKIVDLANPPLDVWRRILDEAGIDDGGEPATPSFGEQSTLRVNCNGGLYLLPERVFPLMREAWPRWTRWLIERPHLLPAPFGVHVDQVAFGLAVAETGLPLDHLPLAFNYPTHDYVGEKPDITPRVLHYHDRVDPSGFLLPVGQPLVDLSIARVNETIRHWRRAGFDNRSFWDFRYTHAFDLGSGLGSRGDHLAYKRDLLAQLVDPRLSVLDVGCGDLEVTRLLTNTIGRGVDVSAAAVEIARSKRPDWRFDVGSVYDVTLDPHDVVIAFDVLIHQRTETMYRGLLGSLFRLARRTLIVSGYEAAPQLRSEMTFHHEPLPVSLARLAGPDRVKEVGQYRDTSVFVVTFDDGPVAPAGGALKSSIEYGTVAGRFLSRPGDLISTHFELFGGHTRNELAMVLSLLDEGDVIVDAGAHIGSFTVPMARRVGTRGLVVAIEPDAGNVELLYQNVVRNDVADRVPVVASTVSADTATPLLAVHDPTNSGAVYHVPGGKTGAAVATSTIDSLVAERIRPRRVALIKLDVEGQELSALESSAGTITSDRPLLYCEIVAAQLERQGHSVADVESFLRVHRYRLFRNAGDRNSTHDRFEIVALDSLTSGGPFFDCLAVPDERVAALISKGRLPAEH